MIDHKITVDEDVDASDGGTMFKAFCTDECGWSAESWQHSDQFTEDDNVHPDDAACEAAERDGHLHLEDVGAI